MNLAKFLKGSTTIGELMQMPVRYLEVMYKQFFEVENDPKLKEAVANEQAGEEIMETMTGGK